MMTMPAGLGWEDWIGSGSARARQQEVIDQQQRDADAEHQSR